MTHVVKTNSGQSEKFDPNKLYRSLYSASLSAATPPGQAQLAAQRVVLAIEPWLQSKQEVTAGDIRRKAGEHLKMYNPHAAYLYGNQPHATRTNPQFRTPRPTTPPPKAYRPPWLDIGKGGHWNS